MKFQEFSSMYNFHKAFPDEQACVDYLEYSRWGGKVTSPFCSGGKVYKCSNNRYRCSSTKKYFTVRTGTVFAASNLPLSKWVLAIYLFSTNGKGISSIQLSKHLEIRQTSAWFMLHRLRCAMSYKSIFEMPLSGVIEADTAWIGGKDGNKHAVKRIHLSEPKAPVIGMVERGGRVIMKHISKQTSSIVVPWLAKNIIPGSNLMTDEGHEFAGSYRYFEHRTIVHGLKEYVHGEVHTNTIEGVWSGFKRNLHGTYHFASKKHLQAYLGEFSYRYNNRKMSPYSHFNNVLDKAINVRLTWSDLTKNGGRND